MLSYFLLFMLPVMTGLGSTLWGQMCSDNNPLYSSSAALLSQVLTIIILLYCGYGQKVSLVQFPTKIFLIYIPIATLVSLLWIFPLVNKTSLSAISMVEICYPIFTVIFTALLFNAQRLNAYHAIGGTIITIGVCLVFYGNSLRSLQ